jgi:hypothetical protein
MWEEIRDKFVKPDVHETHQAAVAKFFVDDTEDLAEDIELNELETISGLAVLIDYQNAKGESGTRLITCRRLDEHGNSKYIYAFCHAREQVRQFRIDRIKEIFDHRTGESLNPVDSFFAKYSPNSVQQSSVGFGLSVKMRADLIALLNALVFVARCDTVYHPLERSVLENLISRFWLRFELSGDPDEEAILKLSDRLAPDAETFWVSLHRIAANPVMTKIMQQTAREVIEADGVMAEQEFYWGTQLDNFFRNNV